MEVHLPKPLHGWREFIGEIGVIVIGVLIALAADQIVERMSWKKHVREAKEDLHGELEVDLFNAQERVRLAPCIDRRLDQLEQIIDHPPATPWKLLPGHGVTPLRIWSTSAWDSAVAADTVAHMNGRERAQYAGVYAFVHGMHPGAGARRDADLGADPGSWSRAFARRPRGPRHFAMPDAGGHHPGADVMRWRRFAVLLAIGIAIGLVIVARH